jgi:hypothetical protein
MRHDLDDAVEKNLAIFREEPEYSALTTLYSVQVIDMTLSAFVLVVSSATDQPPTDWTDLDLILSALALQLPIERHKNRTFMIDSIYLHWLLPTRVDLDASLKKMVQDQRIRLPHLGLVIPQLKRDMLSPWHRARLQLSWEAFLQLRKSLTIAGVEAKFARRVDEALVAKMYLEGRQVVQRFTPEVLQHVLLGDMIFEAHFLPVEYPAVLNYLTALFEQLPIPQASSLVEVIAKVRPYVIRAVHDNKWFTPDKQTWIVRQNRLRQPRHLLTLRELAERRGIKVTGTPERWQLSFDSVEVADHITDAGSTHWHANNAGRARKVLLPFVQKLPVDQLPGRINLPTAIAGAALLGDLMYAQHLQALRYWQAEAFEEVLLTITHPLHAHTKVDFCQFVRLLLARLHDTWSESQSQALVAVVDELLTND